MFKRSLILAAAAALVLGGLSNHCQASPGKGKKDPAQVFKKLDTNADGKLTLEEMKAGTKGDAAKVEKRFKHLDTNKDGFVTLEEYTARKPKKG